MAIQRRIFLGTMGVGAMATSLEAPAAGTMSADGKWDLSWTERVNRKHRAVFDSPDFSDGAALIRAVNWKNEYQSVYGTAPEDMTGVVVVRADGIWLAMNDVFWKTYQVGEARGFKHAATGFQLTNPVATSSGDKSIPGFLASGNIVLACHRAFGSVVALVKKVDGIADDAEAEKKARTFLLPGVILQPSGVFASLRAQEAGCHYILAS